MLSHHRVHIACRPSNRHQQQYGASDLIGPACQLTVPSPVRDEMVLPGFPQTPPIQTSQMRIWAGAKPGFQLALSGIAQER